MDRPGTISAAAREPGFKRATCAMRVRTESREHRQEDTAAQQKELFILHDRLNKAAASAQQLEINDQTEFNWA